MKPYKVCPLRWVFLITFFLQGCFGSVGEEEVFGYNSWKPLVPGDTVYIIAPSHGFPSTEDLFSTLAFVKEHLSNFGLQTKWDEGALKDKDPLCPERAMKVETALADLKQAFNDPTVKAIWALRGGRLSHEMWEGLNADFAPPSPKPLLGFSDITSLHLFLNASGFATVHAPVLSFFKGSLNPAVNGSTPLERSLDILMGKTPVITYSGFTPRNKAAAQKLGHLKGVLLGGNLSSLHYYTTVYEVPAQSTIWMIETIDDYTRIDSILEALRRGELFNNAQAIIFGQLHGKSFSDPDFSKVEGRCDKIITRFGQRTTIPIFSIISAMETPSFCFGHGDWNHAFALGTPAVLEIGSTPQATLLKISAS